jgi:Tfp pilus assembly protein PilF
MPASLLSLEKLEKICSKNPTSILFARLAEGFLRQGNMKRAAEICRQGLRYRPSYAAGHVVMGKCHMAFGHYEEARQEFQKVLQLDADHPAALWHLGKIDLKLGWDDMALRHFELACVLDPMNKELVDQISRLKPEIPVMEMGQTLPDPGEAVDSAQEDATTLLQDDEEIFPEMGVPIPELVVDADLASLVSELTHKGAGFSDDSNINGSEKQDDSGDMHAIATMTLAELYAQQGLVGQAMATLKQVLLRDPSNERVQARLDELRS